MGKRSKKKRIKAEATADEGIGAVKVKTEAPVKAKGPADSGKASSSSKNQKRTPSSLVDIQQILAKILKGKQEIKANADEDVESLGSDYECPDFSDEGTEYGDAYYEEIDCDEVLNEPPELKKLSELLSKTALEETDREASKAAIDHELKALKTPFCLLLSEELKGSESPTAFEKHIRAHGIGALTGIDAVRAKLLENSAVKLFLVRLYLEFNYCDGRGGGPWTRFDSNVGEYDKWFDLGGHLVEGCGEIGLCLINPDGITHAEAWGTGQSREFTFLRDDDRIREEVWSPFGVAVVPVAKVDEGRRPEKPRTVPDLGLMDAATLLALLEKDACAPPTDEDTKFHLRSAFRALLAHDDAEAIRNAAETIPIDALLPSDLVALSRLPSWPSTFALLVASKTAALPERPNPFELASLWRLVAGTDGEEAVATYVARQPEDCRVVGWRWERDEKDWLAAVVEELLMHPVLTEKMKAAVQLRFDALAERILKYRKRLWAIPEAVFAENKEIEEFLRGGKQKMTVHVRLEEAKRIEEVLEEMESKAKRDVFLEFSVNGGEVELHKERFDTDCGPKSDMVRWHRFEEEMKRLKKALRSVAGTKRKLEEESDEEKKAVKMVKVE
ncbi:hypothetical protein HDU96_010450 [Phlyctochytrium bullatum]|nr:hypothetical protein HDU96_010450 [Phlyctochytrium bullatum]